MMFLPGPAVALEGAAAKVRRKSKADNKPEASCRTTSRTTRGTGGVCTLATDGVS